MEELTELEKKMLDTMDVWRKQGGSLMNEIVRVYRMKPIQFFTTLAELIDRPAALAYRPVLVRRLQRLQERAGRDAVWRRRAADRDRA